MRPPRATYRLQFRQGMDFARAAGLAPYLARLGVSHLYASPLFQAVPGSTHGYDVTDHGRFDDELGGLEGFLRLSAALKAEGLGLILDIVPNHMAASPHNPWWRDLLRHGRDSAYAGHFDIDWSAPKLLLPKLGQPFGSALDAGELALGCDAEGLLLRYYEHAFPLTPSSWPLALEAAGEGFPAAESLPAWLIEPDNAGRLDSRLAALSKDRALLERLHAAQPWRLAHWRAGRDGLTYRRFFEISDLVGVRVEDERVFDDVHRLLFELLRDGHVDGVRVDHVDGLADPAGYLRRLKDSAPGAPPIWVEKILAPDEALPSDWPVAGTTGYEFARSVGGLLTDQEGAAALTAAYHDVIGAQPEPQAMLTEAKVEILTHNLAAELAVLVRHAGRAAAGDPQAGDWGPDTLRRALVALACAMPVYRTYLDGSTAPSDADDAILTRVEGDAKLSADLDDPAAVADLVRLLRFGQGEDAQRLRLRFQQTTGALMAKAMEDTLFYRYGRLLSANEVGAEPEPLGLDAEAFDRAVQARAARQPDGLNATATHDTKRGEDARMRIAAIADRPAAWSEAVRDWDALLAPAGSDAPGPETRWCFYQALLGAWAPGDRVALAARLSAYMLKAAREAKRETSWTRTNEAYERQLTGFVERALTADDRFAARFAELAAPFIAAGARKSLVQLALKLTLPGIPDIYQGTEWADLSLVDPDNRRPVDFAARSAEPDGPFDGMKASLLQHLLAMRRDRSALFALGRCQRLEQTAAGQGRYLGYGRQHERAVLLVLCELRTPLGNQTAAPAFVLPGPWRSLALRTVFPDARLDRTGDSISPHGGFGRSPVIVALGETEL